MLIFLTGMMGSGKTTAGRLLAEELSLPFFDTDEIISSIAGMTVDRIFAVKGEKYFRDMETGIIINWKLTHGVIATGGGLPCHDNLMTLLNEKGSTVYLECPAAILLDRVGAGPVRPLLAGLSADKALQKLTALINDRESCYAMAKIRVDAVQLPEKVARNIIRELYS